MGRGTFVPMRGFWLLLGLTAGGVAFADLAEPPEGVGVAPGGRTVDVAVLGGLGIGVAPQPAETPVGPSNGLVVPIDPIHPIDPVPLPVEPPPVVDHSCEDAAELRGEATGLETMALTLSKSSRLEPRLRPLAQRILQEAREIQVLIDRLPCAEGR
jgi:hypothetical protein